MDTPTDSVLAKWTTPECPFTVEYSPRVLDDIRLAVVDAFFSLPRGGAEIGGILLGRTEGTQVVVNGYAPLDCEHAYGPSFTLSSNDQARLAALIADAAGHPDRGSVVGWYHSHTRSDVFFSAADQEIHRRFFPDIRQIALVIRPHAFQPARAGFFFRKTDGSFPGESCLREFTLDPLP